MQRVRKSERLFGAIEEKEGRGLEMDIISAIKSGKRFRLNEIDWLDNDDGDYCFTRDQLLSEKWETEKQKIELSWEQIEGAVIKNICFSKSDMTGLFDSEKTKKELGFE